MPDSPGFRPATTIIRPHRLRTVSTRHPGEPGVFDLGGQVVDLVLSDAMAARASQPGPRRRWPDLRRQSTRNNSARPASGSTQWWSEEMVHATVNRSSSKGMSSASPSRMSALGKRRRHWPMKPGVGSTPASCDSIHHLGGSRQGRPRPAAQIEDPVARLEGGMLDHDPVGERVAPGEPVHPGE